MNKKSVFLSDIRAWIFILGLLFILSGCKFLKKEQAESAEPAEEPTKEAVIEELSGYPIPTSFEIIKMINEAGASYIFTLSNATDRVDHYITSKDKAVNLGVYGTDLSYASTYGMKQETMLYLESSKRLIDEMGITTAFNVNYAQRIEDNMDEKDSLIAIISDSFYDTWSYLTTNEKNKQAILVVSGSWIEGLYITTQIAITARDRTPFLEIIARQKNSLHKLLEVVETVKEDADLTGIYSGLMELNAIYEGIGDDLTPEQLEQIVSSIESLRQSIV